MKESLATFRKAVNESADLQEKLKEGTDLVELGKENGYDFSQEDVTAAFEELKDSDEELTCFDEIVWRDHGSGKFGVPVWAFVVGCWFVWIGFGFDGSPGYFSELDPFLRSFFWLLSVVFLTVIWFRGPKYWAKK